MKILCKYDKREKGFKLFSGGGQHDFGYGVSIFSIQITKKFRADKNKAYFYETKEV